MADSHSATYGSLILGTSRIRVHDGSTGNIEDKELSNELVPGTWTYESTKAYIVALLNLLPQKLDCFVLVNPVHFTLQLCQAAMDGVTEGTKVKVISSLMARFLYVTNEFPNPLPEKQQFVILTRLMDLSDFHVLTRERSMYVLTHEWLAYSSNIPTNFSTYRAKYPSAKAVIVYDQHNENLKNEIVNESKKEVHQIQCTNWDTMLLNGGLYKASTLADNGKKNIFDVKEFTVGYQISCASEKTTFIKPGTSLPCQHSIEVKIHDGKGLIRSNPTISCKENQYKRMMNIQTQLPIGSYQIQIKLEENGLGCISTKQIDELTSEPSTSEAETTKSENKKRESSSHSKHTEVKRHHRSPSPHRNRRRSVSPRASKQLSSSYHKESSYDKSNDRHGSFNRSLNFPPAPPEFTKVVNPFLSSQPAEHRALTLPNEKADFMVCFNDNWVSVCLPQKVGLCKRIKNINGNEWTPLYVSFAKEVPVIGEFAQLDLRNGSNCVIYDVYKILGFLPKDIGTNPGWPFKVAYTGNKHKSTVIEVNTYKGEHSIDPMIVYSLFLIGMRKEVERVTGRSLRRVFIKKTSPVGKGQADALREAARMAELEWIGIETMPQIHIDDML